MLLIDSGDMNNTPYNGNKGFSEYLISYWETINKSYNYSDALIQIFHIGIAKAWALQFIITACMDF